MMDPNTVYRGKTIEEIQSMEKEEYLQLLPSRERRKVLRGFNEQEEKLLKKIRNNEQNIKTHCRDMVIIPELLDKKFSVYNGKEFVVVNTVVQTFGMRLGQLAPSRKIGVKHAGGKK